MEKEESLRHVQLALFWATDYTGSTTGEASDSDRAELEEILLNKLDRLDMDDADLLILTLKVRGYNDALIANGVAGEQTAIALRKAFGIQEPEKVDAAVLQQS